MKEGDRGLVFTLPVSFAGRLAAQVGQRLGWAAYRVESSRDIARCAGVPDHPLGALEHRAVVISFVVSVDLACGIGRSNVAG
jgi:hypothetical protein